MLKKIPVLLMMIMPVALPAQDGPGTNIPVQAQYSEKFEVEQYYFNRRIDPAGKGELLEVELVLQSHSQEPLELYIFAIATFEKVEKTKSSFEMPIPEKERIRNFVPYPDDINNYRHDDADAKEKTRLVKFPKNRKAGVDPSTGSPYSLKDRLVVRTYHLSPYRVGYVFFNNITILVFDGEGNAMFRKLYEIKGRRR